ncbi:MAG: glutathione peroxidase [Spirochaetales bacterium]|nr:glutathione peroxidase [Spirochaetales bacterium]
MIYNFKVKDSKGGIVSLSDYRGKLMLIVNTATGCGFTPQYKGLQKLYSGYRDKGLEILDFPCNQFGNQAPGSDQEITDFCVGRFAVDFKIFSKIDVNGSSEEPLFRYLKREKPGLMGGAIKWNFTKFLVDRDGRVIKRYAPIVTPEKIESDIVSLLS